MIVKQIENQPVESTLRYEIFDTVAMKTADSKTVQVLQLRETLSVEDCNQRITSCDQQVASITAEKVRYEAIVAEIEKL